MMRTRGLLLIYLTEASLSYLFGLLNWEEHGLYNRSACAPLSLVPMLTLIKGGIETPDNHKEPLPYTWAADAGLCHKGQRYSGTSMHSK